MYANVRDADALHVQIVQRIKDIEKSGLHEAPPKREFKEYYGIFRWGQFDKKFYKCGCWIQTLKL